jgi:hypothetical protein
MPDPVSGILAATSLGGAAIGSSSASKASKAQQAAADAAVAEQRAAREQMRALLQPYVAAGGPALQAQLDLLGLGGSGGGVGGYLSANPDVAAEAQRAVAAGVFGSPEEYAQWHYQNFGQAEGRQMPTGTGGADAQAATIAGLENSPIFQALVRQGEEGILQNASATGGLRGGNVQGALAQFRPAMLNQQIQQRFSQLGGITQLGQNSAAGVGNAGLGAAGNIAALLEQKGAAQAGGALAQGKAWGGLLNGISSNIGMAAGIGQKFATGGF